MLSGCSLSKNVTSQNSANDFSEPQQTHGIYFKAVGRVFIHITVYEKRSAGKPRID